MNIDRWEAIAIAVLLIATAGAWLMLLELAR